MTDRRLLVATRSVHKLRELRELLELDHTTLVSLDDLAIEGDPVEDGATFETNAAIKARFGVRASGLPTLADDSGIEVDALGGGAGCPDATVCRRGRDRRGEQRQASRRAGRSVRRTGAAPATCACSRWHSPMSRVRAAASGWSWPGGPAAAGSRPSHAGRVGSATTRSSSRPASRPGGRTLGLWTPAEKHAISHRARAARRMAPRLAALGF